MMLAIKEQERGNMQWRKHGIVTQGATESAKVKVILRILTEVVKSKWK